MKILAIVLFVAVVRGKVEGAQNSAPSYFSKRAVEIEWDLVPEATQYDLEIYDGKNKKFIKKFSSQTNIFKLNVKMGKYFFRSRIFDRFGRSSEWTDLAELVIAPPPAKLKTKLPEGELYAGKATGKYEIPIEWGALPDVETYKIILETPEGKVERELDTKQTSMTLQVPPGQYRIRVQAILPDGTLGEPSEPSGIVSVLGAKIQAPTLQFKKNVEKLTLATVRSELAIATFDGFLFYRPLEGPGWIRVQEFHDLKERELLFGENYKPGSYRLKLKAKAKGFSASDFGEIEFIVKPKEKILQQIPEDVVASTLEH